MRILISPLNRFIVISLLFSALFTLTGCSSVKYHELKPASSSLKNLNTYRWQTLADTLSLGSNARQFDDVFKAEVNKGMAARGYILSEENAELSLDYRIAVVVRPGIDESVYEPHWTRDNMGNFRFSGWNEPQGTGNMLEHGVITLSFRSTEADELLWEIGASKLLSSGAGNVKASDAAKAAARALLVKIPKLQ